MTDLNKLKSKIKSAFSSDLEKTQRKLSDHIMGDVRASVINTIGKIPSSARHTKSDSVTPSDITNGMSLSVSKEYNGYKIKFWHVPSLESYSQPTSDSIPIWSMLNYGSGPKARPNVSTRGHPSVSMSKYLQYTVPLRHGYKDISRTTSMPPSSTTSDFVWWRKRGRGDRGEGFYIPAVTIQKIEAARAKKGKKVGVAIQPMAYYSPRFYIEKSVNMVAIKLRSLFGGKGLVPKNPIR